MKKENIILAVVIAALSLYLASSAKNKTSYTLPAVNEVNTSEITDINIIKNNNTIFIKKKDSSWVLTNKDYQADQSQIDNMLDVIKKIELTALVSENRDKARYELDDVNKISVVAKKTDQIIRKINVGKTASTYNHTFVSLEGDDKVYQAKGNFKPYFDKTIDQLREKSVLSFKPEKIKTILISKNNITRTFTQKSEPLKNLDQDKVRLENKKKKIWRSDNNTIADKKAMEDFINTLKSLECGEYTKIEKKDVFWNKQMLTRITFQGTNELVIFKKDNNKYPAISSDNDYPFLLSAYNGGKILELVDKILGI